MKIAITGATGFVGLNLIPHLQKANHNITALIRPDSNHSRIPDSVKKETGDVLDVDSLRDVFEDKDAVIHLAAVLDGNKEKIRKVNVDGTRNVAAVAEQNDVDQFVFTSTVNVHPSIPKEDITAYEDSKQRAENQLLEYDLDITVVYPSYIWGPRDFRLSRYHYIQMVDSNAVLFPPLYSPGKYNIVHVDDVCDVIRSNLHSSAKTQQLVTGKNVSSYKLFKSLARNKRGRCSVLPFPSFLVQSTGPLIDKLYNMGYLPVDREELLSERNVGYVPPRFEKQGPDQSRDFTDALADTYQWYRSIDLISG
jgi:nucleoside-diphosphate-sugar epimerase